MNILNNKFTPFLLAATLSACGGFPKSSDSFMVESEPAGASVDVMGENVGTTPLTLELDQVFPTTYPPERESLYGKVRLHKAGCEDSIRSVSTAVVSRGLKVELECEAEKATAAATGDKPARERLTELEQLLEEGLISEQEYQALRQKVLESL